jgi:DNA-binding response OmpR family regulator
MATSQKRILLFEKDRNFATLIEGVLEKEGYEVETTGTLPEVQDKPAQHEHDVLIVSKSSASESEVESLRRIDSNLKKTDCKTA